MTPEQQKESEDASILMYTALIALGAQALSSSKSLYEDIPPLPDVTTGRQTQRWLNSATELVMRQRIRPLQLALAYYRYQRALTTGTTIALPGEDNPPYLTLFELKRQFDSMLDPDAPTPENESEPLEGDDTTQIPVEEIEGLAEDLEALEEETRAQVEENLLVLGPINQDRKTRGVRYVEAQVADNDRATAHDEAGNRQAAASERHVLNGARAPLFLIGEKDPKALGFIRMSSTGTPCGWCAMLISRGFVQSDSGKATYRSDEGTGGRRNADGSIVTFGDLDKYHDNCKCYAVPIFSREQLNADIFEVNRKYGELWPIVTEGLGGKDAISKWRRYFREEAKSQKSQVAAAA